MRPPADTPRDLGRDGRVSSEHELIQRYLAPLAEGMPGAFGLRDDAAVISPSGERTDYVFSMDAIAEGVHFFSTDPPADIGWKALAVNVSDLVAKGADPVAYLMALSFPAAPERDWMEGFARGLGEAQAAFGIGLLGGDCDARPGPVTITITAIGAQRAGTFRPRTTARPGMALYVTGTLGDAALGLVVHRGDSRAERWQLSPEQRALLVGRYLRPAPPHALRTIIKSHAAAAMDLSDGLAKDLGRMAKAGGVGAEVDLTKLPLSSAAAVVLAHDPSALREVVSGGDDYQVLCAIEADGARAFEAAASGLGFPVTRIGDVCDGAGVAMRDSEGRSREDLLAGYDHFGPV